MPILTPDTDPIHAVDPRLANTLWQWLALGTLAVALLPAARGPSEAIGALPFWLVLAPAVSLLALYRHVLAAAWRARLVRATPRRRRRVAAVRAPRKGRGPVPLAGARSAAGPRFERVS